MLSGLAQAQLVDRTDNQFWSDVQVAIPMTKDIDFNILGILRLGRDISRPVDERIGTGFTFRFGQHLTIAPNYLYIATQPVRNRRAWESRLSLPVTLRFNVGKFRLSDRNLFERRIRNPGISSSRYRNRFQIEHPVGRAEWSLSLFVADEVFYDWSIDRWLRNRSSSRALGIMAGQLFRATFQHLSAVEDNKFRLHQPGFVGWLCQVVLK